MQNQPVQIEKKGVQGSVTVWANETMDNLRKTECLCFNCGNLKPGQSDNCVMAQQLFQICLATNLAMAITRCPVWKPKQ